jgi:hypothetical protein
MDYTLARVLGGTRYENSLTVGVTWPGLGRALNAIALPRAMDEAKGRAWPRHNVEEVGNFQFFLPDLYAREHGRTRAVVAVPAAEA